ncbi:MAG: DUF2272 domain-containing protein [Gammaproteobacteria bacterium]|nr:DUF2272 domain-containing protein [Gammaproteobacteria bacterium]
MRKPTVFLVAALVVASGAHAQPIQTDRLSAEYLDVVPPSARVAGIPGEMRITDRSCRATRGAELRRRIVDVAVQEWGFFGFPVLDETNIVDSERPRRRSSRRHAVLDPEESERVADSIAGYWSITPDGRWILSRQNEIWKGHTGVAARWRDPWSAAFISWVMCEGGLGDRSQFRRAIAHHAYIDQAIEARDTDTSQSAYIAYDVGEMPIEPGDLLCFSRRPKYGSLAERRRELGTGIRSHCDIVIKLDPANERILGIGGNVRGAVRMKLLPAVFDEQQATHGAVETVSRGRRAVFAHLKLRADSIGADALETSPTIQALRKQNDALAWLRQQLKDENSIRFETVSRSALPVSTDTDPIRTARVGAAHGRDR